jgi:ornithine carbamoyltransferase
MVKHLLTLKDFSSEEIRKIIDLGERINKGKVKDRLDEKTLVMIFQKTSTRTRISFETGMTKLGGHAIFLDARTTQLGISDLADEGKVISGYADIIMARLLRHKDLQEMASASEVPVINGLCEKYHPCQILGDLLTIKEKLGSLEGKKLVYLGIANNVSNSLSVGATKVGMNFTLCAPERHPPSLDQDLLDQVKKTGLYTEEKDPKKAIEGADAVYTDTWVDMEFFTDPKFKKEKERRMKKFLPYQLNMKLLKNSKALIMHDMPMHIDYEISRDAVESKNSVIFKQAYNRMPIQQAVILHLLKD